MPKKNNKPPTKLNALRVASQHMHMHMTPNVKLNARKLALAHPNIGNAFWNNIKEPRNLVNYMVNALDDGEIRVRQVPPALLKEIYHTFAGEYAISLAPRDTLYVIEVLGRLKVPPVFDLYRDALADALYADISDTMRRKLTRTVVRLSSKDPVMLYNLVSIWSYETRGKPNHDFFFDVVSRLPRQLFRLPKPRAPTETRGWLEYVSSLPRKDRVLHASDGIENLRIPAYHNTRPVELQSFVVETLRAVAKP
jgi:hypothetical protein